MVLIALKTEQNAAAPWTKDSLFFCKNSMHAIELIVFAGLL